MCFVCRGEYQQYIGQANLSFDVNVPYSFYWGEGVSVAKADISESTPILPAKQVYSCGTAQADIRPITYEDGSPLIENNRLYYTASSRTGGAGPIVLSLEIGTSKISMTGCLQTYFNEKIWKGAAPHVMYNRQSSSWQITIPVHKTGIHTLAVCHSYSDVRFGVTPLYFKPLDYQLPTLGDEDAMIFYDTDKGKWVMVYASLRAANNSRSSRYVLRIQESQYPDKQFVDRDSFPVCESIDATGVSISRVGGQRYVFSGDSAGEDGYNRYVVCDYNTLEKLGYLNIDLPDKGYRGWNNLTPIVQGDRTRYILLTFDRGASTNENNWTYGNWYLYESKETNMGFEFDQYKDNQRIIRANVSDTFGPLDLHLIRQMSKRNMLNMELTLSEICLDADILNAHAEVYPVRGDGIKQYFGKVYSKGSESMIIGGIHQPYSNYILSLSEIENGDQRYLWIGKLDEEKSLKVMFKRIDSQIVAECCKGDGQIESIGIVPKECEKAWILICSRSIYIYAE